MPDPATIVTFADEGAKDLRRQDQANLHEQTSLVGPSGGSIEFPLRQSDNVLAPGLETPPVPLKPLRLFSEQTSIAPASAPHVAAPPMAPGIGGYNIELPEPKANRILDFDFKNALASQTTAQSAQQSTSLGISAASFLVNLLAVGGFMLVVFLTEVNDVSAPASPLRADTSNTAITSSAHLFVEHQQGPMNEPLPLGILLKDSAGAEIVRVDGLANGTELSLGSSLGLGGWMVSAADIDKTFVGPPKDFVGSMNVTVDLLSATGQLIDRQVLRFEWADKNGIVSSPPAPP